MRGRRDPASSYNGTVLASGFPTHRDFFSEHLIRKNGRWKDRELNHQAKMSSLGECGGDMLGLSLLLVELHSDDMNIFVALLIICT